MHLTPSFFFLSAALLCGLALATHGDSRIERTGTFVDGDAFHTTRGKVNITQVGDAPAKMTFSNWECTNGPAVFAYLVPNAGQEHVRGGLKVPIEAVPSGEVDKAPPSFSQDLPSSVDITRYNGIVIWCEDFSVYFGGVRQLSLIKDNTTIIESSLAAFPSLSWVAVVSSLIAVLHSAL